MRSCVFLAGGEVLADFSCALLAFLPKGEVDGEEEERVRDASATRPLGLMKTDSKLVQHVVSRALTPHVAAHARTAQGGFVARRHLVENVAELDTEMRYHALGPLGADAHRLPCAIFFDLWTAFPSIDHGFLEDSLSETGVPAGALHFIVTMYAAATLWMSFGDGLVEFSRVSAGVLRGSPLSGSLFVMVMDSPLAACAPARMMSARLSRASASSRGWRRCSLRVRW